MPEIQVTQGSIEYREQGAGAPVVLLHGLLVNGHVWDPVVSALSGVTDKLVAASHETKDAALSDAGIGLVELRKIADFVGDWRLLRCSVNGSHRLRLRCGGGRRGTAHRHQR